MLLFHFLGLSFFCTTNIKNNLAEQALEERCEKSRTAGNDPCKLPVDAGVTDIREEAMTEDSLCSMQ